MSNVDHIPIADLVSKIAEELGDYQRDVIDKTVTEETKKAMKDLVQKTKATAPVGKRTKHYRDNISSKVLNKKNSGYGLNYSELWYVKGSDYRLSHLLNNGHALRDGGRYEGTKFITKATDEVETAYLENLKKAIENGGR
jgi:hypothetical protein